MPSWVGISMVPTTKPSSASRPRNRSREKAKPAIVEVSSTQTVITEQTIAEFTRASPKLACSKAVFTCSQRFGPGSTAGGYFEIVAWSCEATTSDQYSGKAQSSTRKTSSA